MAGWHRHKRYGKRLLLLLLVLLLCAWAWQKMQSTPTDGASVMQPLACVTTERRVCAVTLSLCGTESESALRLLASVCAGLEVRPYVFVTPEQLERNEGLRSLLSFADIGLLLDPSAETVSRKRTLRALDAQNDRFYAQTGTFPHLVRVSGDAPGKQLSEALRLRGQVCIGNAIDLSEIPTPGCIVDCGTVNGTTGYLLAKFCASLQKSDYTVLPLPELQALA